MALGRHLSLAVCMGWWQVLLGGAVGAVIGGLVAAGAAWGVFIATNRRELRRTDELDARRAATDIIKAAGPFLSTLSHASKSRSLAEAAAARATYTTDVTANLGAILKVDEAFGTQIIERMTTQMAILDGMRIRGSRWMPTEAEYASLATAIGTLNGEIGSWIRGRK
ncbi:MAG TPA: hypothetical protein VFU86_17515 [Terriglobales bacterium]|nr:hypothetical protein [Terriglobales bacterium]